MSLIEQVKRTPFTGKGKPKPLKHKLGKAWHRRIDHQRQLVYISENQKIRIISCRYHYE